MDAILNVINYINDNILWGVPLIVALLGTGIIITICTKAVQIRKFGDSVNSTIVPTFKSMGKKGKKGDGKTISQFEAFSAAISGTVGTGNIVGVASAIISGGPGAVFWMWVSAFFGLATNYSENILGLYYRKKDKDGNIYGGPMYYIENGMKAKIGGKTLSFKWLGMFFAVCCMLAASGMGMVQANNITGTLQSTINYDGVAKWNNVIGYCVAAAAVILTALIVIGGIKRIGKVASMVVPFMSIFFIVVALVIIFMNVAAIPTAFALIFKSAFNFNAAAGGVLGYGIMKAMRFGFARGIFSNEAGLGSSVIAHCASETKEPVKQGLWGIFEVFFDTFIICTLTALTILTAFITKNGADVAITDYTGGKNALSLEAFIDTLGVTGSIAFSIILPIFAFTTIIAWSYYGEKAAQYLFGEKHAKVSGFVFKLIYVLTLAFGAITASDFIWALDDMFNALMALPNLIALICLSGTIVKLTKNYYDRKKGLDVEPMLSAYPERNAELIAELEAEKVEQ